MKKNIKFEIELDEKSLPVNIKMSTTDSKDSIDKIKSLMFSSWDSTKKETLRLDLWTKDMPVNILPSFVLFCCFFYLFRFCRTISSTRKIFTRHSCFFIPSHPSKLSHFFLVFFFFFFFFIPV